MSVVVIVLLGLSAIARADEKPWAKGVPESSQKVALQLYQDGNAEFGESRYAQALAKYREALKHWDHPGIRFNMVVCLVNLDQPLEANEHLEKALVFGEAPLGNEAYAQALTYKKLLSGQLARLKVTCTQAQAHVKLDGVQLLVCPGEVTKILVPGAHQLVASKPGLQTQDAPLMLLPGKETLHLVKLESIRVNTKLVRRWSARTPWVVFGIGVGTAALGGIAEYLAKQHYETYDRQVAAHCPDGCGPMNPDPAKQAVPADIEAQRTRGRLFNISGVALLGAGGAVAVAGLVAVYLNQPKSVVVETGIHVTPTITPGGAGAAIHGSF
jgi:hypothetical protein